MDVQNGMEAKDVVTGFKGRVTGIVYYWTGCNQALLVPHVDKKGHAPDSRWVDIERLEVINRHVPVLPGADKPSGADKEPPKR